MRCMLPMLLILKTANSGNSFLATSRLDYWINLLTECGKESPRARVEGRTLIKSFSHQYSGLLLISNVHF